jgi:hypothetical protein
MFQPAIISIPLHLFINNQKSSKLIFLQRRLRWPRHILHFYRLFTTSQITGNKSPTSDYHNLVWRKEIKKTRLLVEHREN